MRGYGKTLLGAMMAVGAMSSVLPAYSADMPRRNNSFAPAPIFTTSWAGFYAGGHLGYVFGRARSADMDGFKGGLQAGYNFQMDRLVIGGEADIAYSGVDYRGFTESFRQKWIGSGRVRLGYAFERFLPFVTAGFAYTTGTMKAGGVKQSNGHVGYVIAWVANDAERPRLRLGAVPALPFRGPDLQCRAGPQRQYREQRDPRWPELPLLIETAAAVSSAMPGAKGVRETEPPIPL